LKWRGCPNGSSSSRTTTPPSAFCSTPWARTVYQVASAATGYLARGEVQIREPDVILLDVYLRDGMNGPEFLDQYRRSGGRAKVIAISGATL
jgi:CheY-like chemotaxis protein